MNFQRCPLIEALLDGQFEINIRKDRTKELIAHSDAVSWSKGLTISVGNSKRKVTTSEKSYPTQINKYVTMML